MLKPDVEKAIAELKTEFGDTAVTFDEDGQGGAYVVISPVGLPSPPYNSPTFIAFQIPYTYPYSDIYPLYVRSDLRTDGAPREGMSACVYRDRKAMQLSRKVKRYPINPEFDSAGSKVRKVMEWLQEVA